MAYNKTGENASYNFFIENYNYCHSTRNLNKDKIVMGVPFYGIANDQQYSFCQIIEPYSNPWDIEQYELTGHPSIPGTIYWNGPSAIQEKSDFARDNANGIMIWEVSQGLCSFDSTSLLQIIYDEIFGTSNIENNLTEKVKIYPNPVKDFLNITSNADIKSIQLFSVTGQLVFEKTYNNQTKHITINTHFLDEGVYLLKINSYKYSVTKQIVINK